VDNWFASAVLALLIYGFWGFFPKLAVSYINPQSAIVYQVIGGMLVGVLALFLVGWRPESHPLGILFALLTGITGVLGTLFYYAAASRGSISVVVSMTALYPIITICLAFFILHESLTVRQVVGMIFAIAAIVLVSS
jgi:transporter family protein